MHSLYLSYVTHRFGGGMVNLIAIVDSTGGIGRAGQQIIYIPDDLRHFKQLTHGHTIVVGHKTLTTFPHGQPLPGRRNIIVSHNKNLVIPNSEIVHDVDSLLAVVDKDTFVVGGAEVYRQLLPYCNTAYLTQIFADLRADTFLPGYQDIRQTWKLQKVSNPLSYDNLSFQYQTWWRP